MSLRAIVTNWQLWTLTLAVLCIMLAAIFLDDDGDDGYGW